MLGYFSVEALLIGEQQGLVERRIEPNRLISWHTRVPLYLVDGVLVPQDEMPEDS